MEGIWDIMTDAFNGYWTGNLGRMLHFAQDLSPGLEFSYNGKLRTTPIQKSIHHPLLTYMK